MHIRLKEKARYWFLWLHWIHTVVGLFILLPTLGLHLISREQNDNVCTAKKILKKAGNLIWQKWTFWLSSKNRKSNLAQVNIFRLSCLIPSPNLSIRDWQVDAPLHCYLECHNNKLSSFSKLSIDAQIMTLSFFRSKSSGNSKVWLVLPCLISLLLGGSWTPFH